MELDRIVAAISAGGYEPFYKSEQGVIYCADCLKILPLIPDGAVDLVLTDPPYGMSYVSSWRKHSFDAIVGDSDLSWVPGVFAESFRVLGPDTAIYCFCNDYAITTFRDALGGAGFTPKRAIVWRKNNHTSGDLEGDYGNITEFIQWGAKGRHILNGKRRTNCWDIDREATLVHPTQKPVESATIPIDKSSHASSLILGPFLGSGTTAVAAKQLGRKFIGIEINMDYCRIAEDRLRQEELF